jgi:hypothetical protein
MLLDKVEDFAARADKALSRRRFFGTAGKWAGSLAAAAAGLSLPVDAMATYPAFCCNLYYPNFCATDVCRQCTCADGCYVWYCRQGNCLYKCGECYCDRCSWVDVVCQGHAGCPC